MKIHLLVYLGHSIYKAWFSIFRCKNFKEKLLQLQLLVGLLLLSHVAAAQLSPSWKTHIPEIDGMGVNSLLHSATDREGNVLLLSTKKVTGAQVVLTKISTTGKVLWQNNLRKQVAGEDEMPEKVALDAAGNIYAFAKTRNQEGYTKEAILAKFSPEGHLLWHKMQFLQDVQVQGDVVYVLGNISRNGANHVLVRKLDGNGQTLWEQPYADGFGNKLAIDPMLGVILAGTKQSHVPYESNNLLLLRYDAKEGSLVFEKTYSYKFATSQINTYNTPGLSSAIHVTSAGYMDGG